MKDHKNLGYLLELELFRKLQETNLCEEIYTETDLRKLYGFDAVSIDFLVKIDNQYVAMQLKWTPRRKKENRAISNFLKSCDYVSKCMNIKISFGLWISRIEPFDDNSVMLKERNVYVLSYFHNIQNLVNMTINFICQNFS
jgi:hypothetical protein